MGAGAKSITAAPSGRAAPTGETRAMASEITPHISEVMPVHCTSAASHYCMRATITLFFATALYFDKSAPEEIRGLGEHFPEDGNTRLCAAMVLRWHS